LRLCCDICNPADFLLWFAPAPEKTKCRKIKIKTQEYSMEQRDFDLRQSLNIWRKDCLIADYGEDDFLKPQLILSDQICDHIINLAHHSQLSDIKVLQHQTEWCHASTYGTQILDIVWRHAPPPPALPSPFSTAPLQRLAQQDTNSRNGPSTSRQQAPKAMTCGACGQKGHTGEYLIN
jgi:hypothetical protein